MTCRETATPGQYSRLPCARGSTQRPVRTEQVLNGFLLHHNRLLYSYQLCFVPESLQFCSWGKRNCTSHKSKGLCFVLLGTADLLRRIKDPEGPAENKQLTCRGHKVYFAISFSMPHFSIRANAFHHGLNISLEPARYPTRWCPSANREQHIPHKQKRRQCRYCIQWSKHTGTA